MIPLIFIIQLYLADWSLKTDNLIFWGWMANIFGILEHINYYSRQLMIDNLSDLDDVMRNRKLKIASLAKDLWENQIYIRCTYSTIIMFLNDVCHNRSTIQYQECYHLPSKNTPRKVKHKKAIQ